MNSSHKKNRRQQKVFQCYHCGNQTLMNLVGEHREDWGDVEYRGYIISSMYICPVCQRTTYVERYWEDGMIGSNYEELEEEKICYPVVSLDTSYIPVKIKTAFEGALKSRNTDSALCLIGLRRTLEMVCKEKGATLKTLEGKIEELVKNNILPPTLKEASDITRHFGNSAAHADQLDVSIHELNLIIEFVESVIDYIYVIPQKMIRFKKTSSAISKKV